jgi:DNA-binding NtrC family response regulator
MKRQKSILVVDDQHDIGEHVKFLLDRVYEEVIYCSSALVAQDYVKQRAFSLILSDVTMPGMMGHEFVTILRSIGRIEPVIFVTGNITKDILMAALRLGVSDVIEKPFLEKTLLDSVERTLEIDKRNRSLYENIFLNKDSDENNQKKMIGLLQVARTRK